MKKNSMKQNKQNVAAAPVTLDDIDIAGIDLGYVKGVINCFFAFEDISAIDTGTVSALCYEARKKIEGLEKFINSVHAATPYGGMSARDAKAA